MALKYYVYATGFLAIAFLLGACERTAQVSAKLLHAKLCEVIAAPQEFDGRLVRMRVRYQADRHGSVITDCPCRHSGVAVVHSSDLTPTAEKLLANAVYSRRVQDFTQDFTVTLIGIVRWNNPAAQGPPTYIDCFCGERRLSV